MVHKVQKRILAIKEKSRYHNTILLVKLYCLWYLVFRSKRLKKCIDNITHRSPLVGAVERGAVPMNILADELANLFEEVQPMEFYREIFPVSELDEWRENPKERAEHRYTGIIVEVTGEKKPNGKQRIKRYTVTDELDEIDGAIWRDTFQVLAPISYVGKSRKSENARVMYALVVELDNLTVRNDGTQSGLKNLIGQWSEKTHWIPRPTYTVASGNGLHLYYLFEQGIPLFPNVVKSLEAYKRELTRMIWNRHTTKDYEIEKIQFESIFQAFRMVGTITKKGDRVHAFRTGERVSIEYMNSFIVPETVKKHPETQITQIYKSKLTLAEAKKKYPDWYERRIERKEPKGHWICKKDLYNWWKRRIEGEGAVGHRYYCLMMLCIYAVKCDVSREELEADCLELAEVFEGRTESEDNHFTEKDVIDALQSFEDKGLITYPVTSIANRSGIQIEKNKRNGRKQKQHCEVMRAIESITNPNWREGNGRKPKQDVVQDWRTKNPNGTKADCIRATGLSKPTVYRWWKEVE